MSGRYHMRRMDKAIKDPATLRRVLGEAKHITVAMCRDGMPYLVVEGDSFDTRNYSAGQMRTRVESFAEVLRMNKAAKAGDE